MTWFYYDESTRTTSYRRYDFCVESLDEALGLLVARKVTGEELNGFLLAIPHRVAIGSRSRDKARYEGWTIIKVFGIGGYYENCAYDLDYISRIKRGEDEII